MYEAIRRDMAKHPILLDYSNEASVSQLMSFYAKGIAEDMRWRRGRLKEVHSDLSAAPRGSKEATVLIVGGSRGIGLELARQYAQTHQQV